MRVRGGRIGIVSSVRTDGLLSVFHAGVRVVVERRLALEEYLELPGYYSKVFPVPAVGDEDPFHEAVAELSVMNPQLSLLGAPISTANVDPIELTADGYGLPPDELRLLAQLPTDLELHMLVGASEFSAV
ncbi:MAG: hypothetical protein KTR31_20175 [Myxococcales bacterium]|nr:hypothetical protein [Myxococcales bacterium]